MVLYLTVLWDNCKLTGSFQASHWLHMPKCSSTFIAEAWPYKSHGKTMLFLRLMLSGRRMKLIVVALTHGYSKLECYFCCKMVLLFAFSPRVVQQGPGGCFVGPVCNSQMRPLAVAWADGSHLLLDVCWSDPGLLLVVSCLRGKDRTCPWVTQLWWKLVLAFIDLW